MIKEDWDLNLWVMDEGSIGIKVDIIESNRCVRK
jgi:hypothetical protein